MFNCYEVLTGYKTRPLKSENFQPNTIVGLKAMLVSTKLYIKKINSKPLLISLNDKETFPKKIVTAP